MGVVKNLLKIKPPVKTIYDPNENEYIQVLMIGKSKYSDRHYIKMFISFIKEILEDEQISGKPLKLLLYITNIINYNNLRFYLFPNKASKDLNVSLKTYYRWLSILLEKGIINRISKYEYELATYTLIKGQVQKALEICD